MAMSAVDPVRIELLGPVRAWRAGEELDLGPARRRGVFAMLASKVNQVVSREELIDGIWGSAVPTAVDSSLYTYISALRRCLDPDRAKRSVGEVLVSAGSGYSLRISPEAVDVNRFHQLRQTGRQHWDERNPTAALAAVDSALALWHGEPLSGIGGPFADGLRERLGELRLVTIERRAEVQLAIGAQADVVAELTDLSCRHPLREPLHRLLMLALYRLGQRSAALEVYQRARVVLVDRLGIEPGPELRRLHRQVLIDDSALLPPRQPGAPAPGSIRTSVVATPPPSRPRHFVGRQGELARLRYTLRDLARGRGGVVWVEGEPGIGKSALLAQSLATHLVGGTKVLWGNGDQFARHVPLRLVTRLLGTPQQGDDSRPEPGIATASAHPYAEPIHDVLGVVRGLCATGPLILVMDDIQWADEASLYVWQEVCALTGELPLLLVGINRLVPRRPELKSLRAAVRSHGGAEFVLDPLNEAQVDELVERKLGSAPQPRLRCLTALAAGNPRYVHDLLDGLVADRLLETGDGTVDAVDSALGAAWSTDTMVISRLDFLARTTAEMLRIAASIGTGFDLAVLAGLLGKRPSEVLDAVDEAVAAGVLAETGDRLFFRHPVVWRALYQSIPRALRQALRRGARSAAARWGVVDHEMSPRKRWPITSLDDVCTVPAAAAAQLHRSAAPHSGC
jgi:DNA-binding SARP family transcriptional activator